MTLPLPSSPVWADIISGKKAIAFESLTIKIFLGSAQQRFKLKPETMSQIVAELHNLFEKNIKIPTVQRDIEKLA
ncbi:MAG: hypothetical protein JST12_02385 [Armatimonadetes bacterium]|nr:hypothetical protein [Armatimonadota bacterium]MBS1700482.1 hypothetical protein [Armatimonadota bacterium]MBS1725255.1 hypothetical protein [Armatimonadota bacterium]